MSDHKPRVIAFYLPQFHPIPENDAWWGKGFTEWTNVARAKRYFPGHYQPRIPADLGFYDLRVPEVREAQAELARSAGIEGFCYYHYWFGSKNTPKELLQRPFNEVVASGKPDFPFCLCWANHGWERRDWNAKASFFDHTVLVEQQYYGIEDYTGHFYSLLPAFKDKRYLRVDGRLLFVIYIPGKLPDIQEFINCWNSLAEKENLPGFYFVGYYGYENRGLIEVEDPPFSLLDANILSMIQGLTNDTKKQNCRRWIRKGLALLFHVPAFLMDYDKARKKLIPDLEKHKNVIPEILCGFDHSPRTGRMRLILNRFTPDAFFRHVRDILKKMHEADTTPENIIFLKSWNEWGEGNYLEPDLKWGHAYLDVLAEILRGGGYNRRSVIRFGRTRQTEESDAFIRRCA